MFRSEISRQRKTKKSSVGIIARKSKIIFIYDYICQVFYGIIKLGFRAVETGRTAADLKNFILPKWHYVLAICVP